MSINTEKHHSPIPCFRETRGIPPQSFLGICFERIDQSFQTNRTSCHCMGLKEREIQVLNEIGYETVQEKYWTQINLGKKS